MSKLAKIGQWNFAHQLTCLQAELHYLDGNLSLAEAAYQASIGSAREHKFFNHEAMATELFGYFYVENGKREEGLHQLTSAVQKYEHWGAMKKASDVQQFIDMARNLWSFASLR